jgi:Domain of unknown function (DUF1906)
LVEVPGAAANRAVAIIDCAADTRPWLAQLKDRQVLVVIRYLARDKSALLPEKRIADNGTFGTGTSEAEQLLSNGFGIALVYEWGNNNPRKFLFGLDAAGAPKTGDRSADHAAIAAAEADADFDAASAQAGAIGLAKAPIYFTLDFDLAPGAGEAVDANGHPIQYSDGSPVSKDTLVAACDAYFDRLQQKLGSSRLGVYGCGFANRYMLGKRYVTYAWVAQSPGFTETAEFLRTGPWNLFQQGDWFWFGDARCPSGLDLDTNIQNPSVTDIGAFGKDGPYLIDAARTLSIFSARSVAVKAVPLHTQKDAASPVVEKKRCDSDTNKTVTISAIKHNSSVRVLADDGTWLSVDIDEDGIADGYALKQANFVPSIKDTPDYHQPPAEDGASAIAL